MSPRHVPASVSELQRIGLFGSLPGETIVKGTPSWIHFGKGDSESDMQLTPGKHRLALQLGDDLHNTVKGLCSTITVNVTQ